MTALNADQETPISLEWSDDARSPAALRLGGAVFALADNSAWILRRQHEVQLIDAAYGETTVTLEIDCKRALEIVERNLGYPVTWGDSVPLPVATLNRDTVTSFEVEDEAGALLPRATKPEERGLVLAGLSHQASTSILGRPLDAEAVKELRQTLDTFPVSDPSLYARDLHYLMRNEDRFFKLVRTFSAKYLLIVVLPRSMVVGRRLIRFRFTDALDSNRGRDGRWKRALMALQRLWLTPGIRDIQFTTQSVNGTPSVHITVHAPHSIDIHVRDASAEAYGADEASPVVTTRRLASAAHAYFGGLRTQGIDLTCRLSLQPHGLVRTAAFLSRFNLLLLATVGLLTGLAGAVFRGIDGSAAAPLLLLLPGLSGAVIATRQDDSMTSEVAFQTRVAAFSSMLGAFFVTAALAFDTVHVAQATLWIGGIGMAVAATAFHHRQLHVLSNQPDVIENRPSP